MRTCITRERVLFGLLGAMYALVPVAAVMAGEPGVPTDPILWAAALGAIALTAVSTKIVITGTLSEHDLDLGQLPRRLRREPSGEGDPR